MTSTSRRDFLRAGVLGVGAVSLSLYAYARFQRGPRNALSDAMGPLSLVEDSNTGLPLLMLPEGFRYRTFSWAGETLHDGHAVPPLADGMGVVKSDGNRVTMVRNHEVISSTGHFGPAEAAYDVGGGGTTNLVFDTESETLVDSWASLGGTLCNCAGGVTPWGTWLSCEEAPVSPALAHLPRDPRKLNWEIDYLRREHGFVFEVPAEGLAKPEPIKAMGQFYHEAVAIDPVSGIAYMTEDIAPHAGFYRYTPDIPGRLALGGRLQMMQVVGWPQMREGLELGRELPVAWVDIEDPERGFTPGNRVGDGVVTQGMRAGGSAFISLEGCTFHEGRVFFTSKAGGNALAGYIFEYDPQNELIRLVYESPGHDDFSGPDNIVMSPRGSLVVCEDRVTKNKVGQIIAGLKASGEMFRFCQINPDLKGRHLGFKLSETARKSEWAGATFSDDGKWLFANIYDPGVTVAITGPWQEGLI